MRDEHSVCNHHQQKAWRLLEQAPALSGWEAEHWRECQQPRHRTWLPRVLRTHAPARRRCVLRARLVSPARPSSREPVRVPCFVWCACRCWWCREGVRRQVPCGRPTTKW